VTTARFPDRASRNERAKKKPYGLVTRRERSTASTATRGFPFVPPSGALPSLTSSPSSPSPSLVTPQLLRERVQQCYLKEGVNHYQNCKEEVKAYLESIKNVGVHRANIGAHDRAGAI
jgi:hypothetical protein